MECRRVIAYCCCNGLCTRATYTTKFFACLRVDLVNEGLQIMFQKSPYPTCPLKDVLVHSDLAKHPSNCALRSFAGCMSPISDVLYGGVSSLTSITVAFTPRRLATSLDLKLTKGTIRFSEVMHIFFA
jgi:hypothetical protein